MDYFSCAAVFSDSIIGKICAIISDYIFSDNVLLTKCVNNNQKLPAGPRI